ncbi:type I restriction-modification system subunit M N-terminal domain-containing protein [Phascolarctobacterium succinatutens]
MAEKQTIDAMWDDSPIDVSTEVNFIWSIANKLRGTYQSDKYKDVIIPMVIIRRFECALAPTKQKVVETYKANPNYPAKAMYRISGFQFYNTSEFDLAELVNDADHLAANFKAYLQSFSPNVQEIIVSAEKGLDFYKQIDKMDKNNRLLSVVKAFSELDLDPRTIDNVKMGYIFEDLIRRFSENAEAGGNLVFTVEHPVFTAHGTQDWYYNEKGEILHFPVDNYYYEGKRTAMFLEEKVTKYYRTLTTYLNTLLSNSFIINQIVEPQPPENMMDIPGMADEMRRPMMLIVSAKKKM